jgi:hypothetical protein
MTSFVSVTRLRLRSLRFLPGFAVHATRSNAQVRRASGFVAGSLLPDRRLAFWTLTVWDAEASMRAYMVSGAHRAAMPKLLLWCDEASVVHWTTPAPPALPTWAEAARRMRAEGRPSKLRRPSPRHAAMAYDEPRLSVVGASLTPIVATRAPA